MHDDLHFDAPGDELSDSEYPDEPVDDDADLCPCPHCGAEIYDDAVRCPACGTYVTATSNPLAGRPAWWLLLGLAGVVAAILALSRLIAP